jgi:hypothetical protein
VHALFLAFGATLQRKLEGGIGVGKLARDSELLPFPATRPKFHIETNFIYANPKSWRYRHSRAYNPVLLCLLVRDLLAGRKACRQTRKVSRYRGARKAHENNCNSSRGPREISQQAPMVLACPSKVERLVTNKPGLECTVFRPSVARPS